MDVVCVRGTCDDRPVETRRWPVRWPLTGVHAVPDSAVSVSWSVSWLGAVNTARWTSRPPDWAPSETGRWLMMPGGGLEFSCEKPKEQMEDLGISCCDWSPSRLFSVSWWSSDTSAEFFGTYLMYRTLHKAASHIIAVVLYQHSYQQTCSLLPLPLLWDWKLKEN